jgi:nucleotide-binding universal stress UspA family protein
MFRKILVPLDLTSRNARALDVARRLVLGERSAKVLLLHVVEEIEGIPAAELRGFYDRASRHARRKLDAARGPLEKAGARVEARVLVGHRVEEVVDLAASWRADVIVLASHKVAPGGRGFGTISHRVALLARTPVLLVK